MRTPEIDRVQMPRAVVTKKAIHGANAKKRLRDTYGLTI